jgi:hypothetical protein
MLRFLSLFRSMSLFAVAPVAGVLFLLTACYAYADPDSTTKTPSAKTGPAKPVVAKSPFVGAWRDVSLDKLKHLSDDDKKRMQGYMIFDADGTGTYITGGVRKGSRLNTDLHWGSHAIPFKWAAKENTVTFTQDDKSYFSHSLSADGQMLTSTDGNNIRYERFKGPIPRQLMP